MLALLPEFLALSDFRSYLSLARAIDIEYMSSIHSGLFTGVVVGPYAVSGE